MSNDRNSSAATARPDVHQAPHSTTGADPIATKPGPSENLTKKADLNSTNPGKAPNENGKSTITKGEKSTEPTQPKKF
jgi:hypothetical protein